MNEIQVSKNITLIKDNGFGDFDTDVVTDLLKQVDIWLSEALGQPHCSSKKVEIHYRKENSPMCCNDDNKHIIYLSATKNYWCQWVYQFAHEYCHHLINGPLKGELSGLKWFEETICELSSLYCLSCMDKYCQEQKYNIDVKKYIEDKRKETISFYIKDNIKILSAISSKSKIEDEDRNRYTLISSLILDLFLKYPALWRIILNFGNTCEWQELSELFKHLEETADNTYIEPLNELRIRLLGS